MDKADAERIMRALETLAESGRGDVKALKGALKGHYRLRVGKWRAFFCIEGQNGIVVIDVDNRGQAY
jgi:mRNA-degrading endonuclease RelE of RelBE toxin-antitoxin system